MAGLIRERDMAARLNVPLNRLIRLRRNYGAPALKIKNAIYYDVNEFLKWYNETIFV